MDAGIPLGLAAYRVFPDREIASVYFDTPAWHFYLASEEGLSKRVKVRIRTYAEHDIHAPLRLEIKRRNGRVGTKQILPLAAGRLSAAVAEAREAFAHLGLPCELTPTVVVRYRRSYFAVVRRGREIRITWDRNIGFNWFSSESGLRSEARLDAAVLEVKAPATHGLETEQVGRELQIRRSRFSKYCAGVEHIVGRP